MKYEVLGEQWGWEQLTPILKEQELPMEPAGTEEQQAMKQPMLPSTEPPPSPKEQRLNRRSRQSKLTAFLVQRPSKPAGSHCTTDEKLNKLTEEEHFEEGNNEKEQDAPLPKEQGARKDEMLSGTRNNKDAKMSERDADDYVDTTPSVSKTEKQFELRKGCKEGSTLEVEKVTGTDENAERNDSGGSKVATQ